MSGWIKIHRDINKHWIWQNSDYLKWWIDILLEVNHTDAKVVIKNKIYTCKRGQKLYSLDTWATRWNTNKSKVRRFLNLLQNDSMIELKSETQTTRLTVCKYEDYQDFKNESETHLKQKRNANETQMTPIQECKEEKEEKEEKDNTNTPLAFSFYHSLLNYGFDKQLVSEWLKVRKNKKLTNSETAYNGFIKEVEKSKLDKNEVLKECVINSWGGFKADWYKKEENKKEPVNNIFTLPNGKKYRV